MGKQRRSFSEAFKRQIIEEYEAGVKTIAQLASEHGISTNIIYRWRVQLEERDKGAKIDELESQGRSREDARLIAELLSEREAYQRTVGEQTMIIELLKKRLRSTSSQQRSELTGLIETLERAVQSRKRGV